MAQMGWGAIFVPGDFEEAARILIEGILDRVEKDDIPPATDRQEGADR